MNAIKLLATVLLITTMAGTAWAENSCGNASSPPKISSSTIASPRALDAAGNAPANWWPEGGRFELKGIEYIAAVTTQVDGVQIALHTDGCTEIKSVQAGSVVLTPSARASGGYSYNAADTQNSRSAHGLYIWIFFPFIADGTTEQVTVTVVRSGGTGTAAYSFPLVHVRQVQPTGADASIGISGTEIHNLFANALHAKFSGPNNSAVMQGIRVDYDPASLHTWIDSAGIWLNLRLKAEMPCNPVIKISGTFGLDTNAPGRMGLSVRWIYPAVANVETTWCVVAAELLSDIKNWITGAEGGGGIGSVQEELTQEIMSALPDVGEAAVLLDGTNTKSDELLVHLKIPAPSIEIAVPYDAFETARETRFPPGETVGLVANGLGMRDNAAGFSFMVPSGPNGVPNTPATVPDMFTVARTTARVDPGAAVAQLLVTLPTRIVVEANEFRYTPGCKLTMPARGMPSGPPGTPQIRFGVNDTTADAHRLRANGAPGYNVRVIFGLGGNDCVARPSVNR